ncbi:MAG: hypothetical protein ACJAQ2_002378 [Vicingaceae bacterium]|jgi:hypothetical protein
MCDCVDFRIIISESDDTFWLRINQKGINKVD